MAFFVNQCHAQAVLEKYGFRAKTIVLRRHDVFADVNVTLTDKCCFGWFYLITLERAYGDSPVAATEK